MPKQRYTSIGSMSNSNLINLDDSNFNFQNIKNKPISEILKLIPPGAKKRILTPTSKISAGFEFTWRTTESKWTVRIHGPDSSAPPESNAASGWIARIQKGSRYMDYDGNFHPPSIFKTNSPNFSESLCNNTHIPVQNDLD